MAAPLTKTRQVLVTDLQTDGTVHFHNKRDEDERYRTYLLMDATDYEAMGSPEKITVAIEPGDLLNE